MPFFSDFVLEPDNDFLLLAWRERDSDQIFNGSQAADGMLRAIALVTLLLLPDEMLPNLLILDEPELGLHPYAINVIGRADQGRIHKDSSHCRHPVHRLRRLLRA